MSEEEKKAIKYIKEFKNETKERVGNKSTMVKNLNILLKLINKKQKEIEKLNIALVKAALKAESLKIEAIYDNNYIRKDKIRAKIKELEELKEKYFEKQIIQGRIDLLKELLEE